MTPMGISQDPRSRGRSGGGEGRKNLVSFPPESGDDCLSFQYTVYDSTINAVATATAAAASASAAAAQDSPTATEEEATCGFQYSIPSLSPTGPSCSLRLSSENGAKVGINASRISSPAALAGRKLEYFERKDDCGEMTKATTAAVGVSEPRSSPVEGLESRRKNLGMMVPVASSSVGRCGGAITTAAAAAVATAAPARTSTVRETDSCRRSRAISSHSKGFLFATLMDNIDLSQMTPSQPMQEDGGGGATRGREGLVGQELAAAASATTTNESERRMAVGKNTETSCGGDGGLIVGHEQSQRQPESGERYRGLGWSSSCSRHARDEAQRSSSPTPLVAPPTVGFRYGLWSKLAVGAVDNLALDSEDSTSSLPPAPRLTPDKRNSLEMLSSEKPRRKLDASADEAAEASSSRMPNARPCLSPQALPTSTVKIRCGALTSKAVESVVSVAGKAVESAIRAGLVDEAKSSRMPPPARRRVIDGGATPVTAPADHTGAPWTGHHLGFSGAQALSAEEGRADRNGRSSEGEGGGRIEQCAGLEVEKTLDREAGRGGGFVAVETGCVRAVAKPRDSVDSAVGDDSPSSSCMSSSFNLDLATTPESHGGNATDRPELTDRCLSQGPPPNPSSPLPPRGESSRPARDSAESSLSNFCLASSSSPSQPNRDSGRPAGRSPSETARCGSSRRRASTSTINSSTDKNIRHSNSERDKVSMSPWSLALFSSAEASPSSRLEEGRAAVDDVTLTSVPGAGSSGNRKAVERSSGSVENHEHAPAAAANTANANAAPTAIRGVLSPPLANEGAVGTPGDTTTGVKSLSRGVSPVGDPHGVNLRENETVVVGPPCRCSASNKGEPVAAKETAEAFPEGSGAEGSGGRLEGREVGALPYQVYKQKGEKEEEVEEETENVPQDSVSVLRPRNADAPFARRDESSLGEAEVGLAPRLQHPLIETASIEASSRHNGKTSCDGVGLYSPPEESRAERANAVTVFTGGKTEEGIRGVRQTASTPRRDAGTIALPQPPPLPSNDVRLGGRSMERGESRSGSAAAELGPAATDKRAAPTNDRGHTRESKNTSDIPTVAAAAETASVESTCLTDERPLAKLLPARGVIASGGARTLRYGMKVTRVRDDDGDKEPIFTEGAAGRGRTNWAAAVCGREESLTYPGEEDNTVDGYGVAGVIAAVPEAPTGQGPDSVAVAPAPASTSGSFSVRKREKLSADNTESGANSATRCPAQAGATREAGPSLKTKGCGEPGRARSVVKPREDKKKRKREPRQSVSRAQQVVFTSEEENPSSASEGWTVLHRLRSSPVPSFPWESPPENAPLLGGEPSRGADYAASPAALLPAVEAGVIAEAKTEAERMTRMMKESKSISEAKSTTEAADAKELGPCPGALAAAAAVGDSSSRGGGERVVVSEASVVDQAAVDRARAREERNADVLTPSYFNAVTVRPVGELALASSEGRSFSSRRNEEDFDYASPRERPRQATTLEAGRSPGTDVDTEIDTNSSPPGLRRTSSGGVSGTAAVAATVPLLRCRGSNANDGTSAGAATPLPRPAVEEDHRQSETGDSSTLEDWEEGNRNMASVATSTGQAGRKRSRGSTAGNEESSESVDANALSLHQNQVEPCWEDALDEIEETPPSAAARPKKRLKARNLSVEDKAADFPSLGTEEDGMDEDAGQTEVDDNINGDGVSDDDVSETLTITDAPAVDPDEADHEYAQEGEHHRKREYQNQHLLPREDLAVSGGASLSAIAPAPAVGAGAGVGEAAPDADAKRDAYSGPSLRDAEATNECFESSGGSGGDLDYECCSDSETLMDPPSPSQSDPATPPQLTLQQQPQKSMGDIFASPPVLPAAPSATGDGGDTGSSRGAAAGGTSSPCSGGRSTEAILAIGHASAEARELRGQGQGQEGKSAALEATGEAKEESAGVDDGDDDMDSKSTLEEAGAGADDEGCGRDLRMTEFEEKSKAERGGVSRREETLGEGAEAAVANKSGSVTSLSLEMREKSARLAALSRFTAARDKKARLLIAELKRAQSRGWQQADIQRIYKELVALRAETFRYDPKPDAGGSSYANSIALLSSSTSPPGGKERLHGGGGGGIWDGESHSATAANRRDPAGSSDVSLPILTLPPSPKTRTPSRRTSSGRKEQCSSPVPRKTAVTHQGKPRQQRSRSASATYSTHDSRDLGDSEGVTPQARAAQSTSAAALAVATEVNVDADGDVNIGGCPPAPDTSIARGDCARRPKRVATSSLPRARSPKVSSDVAASATDADAAAPSHTLAAAAAAVPTCSTTLTTDAIRRPDREKVRSTPARRTPASHRGRRAPTVDDLNDPIFRAKVKALAKAKAKRSGDEIGSSDGGGGICAAASRAGCGRKARDSTGVSKATEVEGRACLGDRGDEAGRRFGEWISSRQDWCVGDVCVRRASSGVTKDSAPASVSSSKQQLSFGAKPSAAATPTLPNHPKHQQQARRKNTPVGGAARPGGRSSSRRSFEAPRRSASAESESTVAFDPSARCVVDPAVQRRGGKVSTVTTVAKGVKRARLDGSAERNCEGGGGGSRKNRVSATEAGAGVGVGPRSHAKRRQSDAATQREGQDCASSCRGKEETVEITAMATTIISPPRDRLPSASGPSKKDSTVTRAAAKTCRCPNDTPTREQHGISVAAPAGVHSAAAATSVSRSGRQRHGNGGRARGQEMVRQASARGGTSDRRAARGSTEGQEDAANTMTFRGFKFLLVGLPVDVRQEVKETILAGGGALIDEIPSDLREEPWLAATGTGKGVARGLVAPGGEGAATATAEANSSRRKVKLAPQHTAPEEEVDVVIVVSLPAASRKPEYVLAIATGTPLVHCLWVDDSVAQGRALPVGPYLLHGAREASRRRQLVGGAGRRARKGGSMAPGAARLATARVVTKPGTPLTGMNVGVAHPSPHTCEHWGRVLSAAGAQVVRLISAPLLREDGKISTEVAAETGVVSSSTGMAVKARSRRTMVVDGDRSSGHRNSRGREEEKWDFGVDGGEPARPASASVLRAALVGLDCVVCDYPGVWRTSPNGGTDKEPGSVAILESDLSAPPSRVRRGQDRELRSGSASGALALGRARAPSCRRTEVQTHGDAMPMLERLAVAARREGVRMVSLSWATDCAVRGSRIKQQSRAEYLSPFLDVCLGRREPPRISAGASSVVKPRPPMTAVATGINPSTLRAFVAWTGERYEVDDFVRYSAQPPSSVDHGSSDARIGRVVSLEMAPSGRVFVTLEPLREKQQACSSSSSSAVVGIETTLPLTTAGENGAFLRRGKGGVFTRPSKESSVLRGRERRACELMKVAARGSGGISYGIQKMEATCLRGRVCVLMTKEFASRGGYCSRDPDVYVQRKALSLRGSVP